MSSRKTVVVPGAIGSAGSATARNCLYVFGDNGDAVVGNSITPKITSEVNAQLLQWRITANTAPTGSSLIYDVRKGASSIFVSGNSHKIVLPATTVEATGTVFLTSPYNLAVGDKLLLDCIQIGSGNPGSQIEIQIFSQIF